MTLHGVINAIILSLTLTVVLITLFTYLVYKIKRLPTKKKREKEKVFETLFFKRYVSEVEVKSEEKAVKTPKRDEGGMVRRLTQKIRLRTIFVSGFSICFVIFLVNFLVHDYLVLRKQSEKASEYRRLRAAGLLEKRTYNPYSKSQEFAEHLSERVIEKTWDKFQRLDQVKILILSNDQSLEHSKDIHTEALGGWRAILDRYELSNYTIYNFSRVSPGKKVFQYIKKFDLVILPQVQSLSQRQRGFIRALIKKDTNLLIEGALGVLNGLGKKSDSEMLLEIAGIKLIENESSGDLYPANLVSDEAPWWEVPAGLRLNWFLLDNSYLGVVSDDPKNKVVAYESDHSEMINFRKTVDREKIVRINLRQNFTSRVTWIATGPSVRESQFSPTGIHYHDEVIASLLGWTAELPVFKVSQWKGAKKRAMVISIDAEFGFERLPKFFKVFHRHQIPTTIFAVSDDLRANRELPKEAKTRIEWASHSDDHSDFKDQETVSQFYRIQGARMAIEEIVERPVWGFRPPKERYDINTINALVQDRAEYIFADWRFFRSAPVQISDGRIVFFPRIVNDDFSLIRDPSVGSLQDFIHKMVEDYEKIKMVNGSYFFNMHTHVFGKTIYVPIMDEFFKSHPFKGKLGYDFYRSHQVVEGKRASASFVEEKRRWDCFENYQYGEFVD